MHYITTTVTESREYFIIQPIKAKIDIDSGTERHRATTLPKITLPNVQIHTNTFDA